MLKQQTIKIAMKGDDSDCLKIVKRILFDNGMITNKIGMFLIIEDIGYNWENTQEQTFFKFGCEK